MNNFDDEEEEKVVTTKKVFHIREMEFVFEGAEEVARVNDSETSDIESSQDEVEGEAKWKLKWLLIIIIFGNNNIICS